MKSTKVGLTYTESRRQTTQTWVEGRGGKRILNLRNQNRFSQRRSCRSGGQIFGYGYGGRRGNIRPI